jgi:hypothetical protein
MIGTSPWGRKRVQWTAAQDNQIKKLRVAGVTWDGVAAAMGMGRNTVLELGRRIGARKLERPAVQVVAAEPADRPARQAGHPATWDLINAGTVLSGSPYPYPVFL